MKVSKADLDAAVAAVQGKVMSLRGAAKRYKMPHTTLYRHVSGKYNFLGPPTELTAEEEKKIVAWVIDVSRRGFPLTSSELKDTVQMYLNTSNRCTKFTDNRPGYAWMTAFLKRHGTLSIRMTENIDKNRAKVTESMIREWFVKVCDRIVIISKDENCSLTVTVPTR